MVRRTTLANTTSIKPFRRVRRLSEEAMMHRYKTGRPGECYEYAAREILAWSEAGSPEPAMRVIHGTVHGTIEHAWVERGGVAYDWQALAIHGLAPMPIAEYYQRFAARPGATFGAQEIAANIVRESHYGPWPDEAGAR